MYAKAKAEKAALEAERSKYAALQAKKTRGARPTTPEVLRKPEDIREDPRYEGQTTFKIEWVPVHCRDGKTEVDAVTLKDWILFAAVEEDPGSQVFYDDIDRIQGVIDKIDVNIAKIPKLEFIDDDGNPYTVERARAERERIFNELSSNRVLAEEDMEKAQRNLKNHIEWRRSMGVELTRGDQDRNTDTCTWFVRIFGTSDADEMENLLIAKEDWPGINLANGVPFAEPKPIPPWVGRDKTVPDGSKANALCDYSDLQVNIAGARLSRVPNGVGILKHLDRPSSNLYSEEFGVFYGDFESGQKHGYGIEIDDVGTFVGTFEQGNKLGRGRMDLAEGTTITGQLGVTLNRRAPESTAWINPYKDGEPNGQVEIYFGDGGFYKGNIVNGRIQGQGDYQSAFNEVMSGTFQDGLLHGPKCFLQNQLEEVYMGEFCHGELDGRGTYQNKQGDQHEGYWRHNMRHGRGVHYFNLAGCYRGTYVNNLKHGKGSLEYGLSKSRILGKRSTEKKNQEKPPSATGTFRVTAAEQRKKDKEAAAKAEEEAKKHPFKKKPSTASSQPKPEEAFVEKELSEFNNLYQGYFIGNKMSNRGCLMNTRIQMPRIISKMDTRGTLGITKLLAKDERQRKTANHNLERLNDMEFHIRGEIQRKKVKIYRQQKHFTKRTMYQADQGGAASVGTAAAQQLDSKTFLRNERLKNVNVEEYTKKAIVPRLRFHNAKLNENLHNAYQRIKPDGAEAISPSKQVNDKLLKLILSDFDEVQERQRFLKYDRMWQRAEEAYEGARSAAV